MSRRTWTHRRLGIDAPTNDQRALAETESMLAAVGARRTTLPIEADPFAAALLDFACDLDLYAGVAATDAAPVPAELLRLDVPRSRKSRISWKVLIPATSGAMAALVVMLTLLLSGSPGTTPTSGLSATAESRRLLSHADTLLRAAATAESGERASLIREARADLHHVTRLLPLAPPAARPAIRQRLRSLNDRARPFAGSGSGGKTPVGNTGNRAGSGSGGDPQTDPGQHQPQGESATASGASEATATTPPPPRRHRPPPQQLQPNPQGDGTQLQSSDVSTTTVTQQPPPPQGASPALPPPPPPQGGEGGTRPRSPGSGQSTPGAGPQG